MPVPAPSAPHAVNAARLDSPGKAAAARSAGGAGRKPDGGEAAAPDFGHKLSAAIQGKDDKQPDRAAGKAQASDAARAATPAVPAHKAEPSDDDEATAAAGQLDSGLQAFVDSFPAPAIPATSSASSAAVAQESANASAAGEGKDAIAALAGARDAAAARAAIIDDKQAARAHGHAMPVIDAGDNADVEAGAEADAGQAGTPNAHASSRAQGITAGKPATELRAATPDAPGLRKLQPDASPIDAATGGGNGLLQ
ncbi:MAG: hypothetical protein RL404_1027, partial [Pseudomonadota bacterium]